ATREPPPRPDHLADLNDYDGPHLARQGCADDLLTAEGGDPASAAATLLAMGRLQAHLHEGLRRERERFASRFARFASTRNHRRFRELFKA
ncbi:MAG: hypothetical protein AAF725_13385, partial [Acidobacteriota bacterium]